MTLWKPCEILHGELREDVNTLTIMYINCNRKNIYYAHSNIMPKLPKHLKNYVQYQQI